MSFNVTSRKDKDGNYVNCNWFNCKFVGKVKDFGENLMKGETIRIDSALLENVYNKDTGKTYFNLTIFESSYENAQNGNKSVSEPPEAPTQDFEDDQKFPF